MDESGHQDAFVFITVGPIKKAVPLLLPSSSSSGGSRLLHLGSAVALGVHLSVQCVSFE